MDYASSDSSSMDRRSRKHNRHNNMNCMSTSGLHVAKHVIIALALAYFHVERGRAMPVIGCPEGTFFCHAGHDMMV